MFASRFPSLAGVCVCWFYLRGLDSAEPRPLQRRNSIWCRTSNTNPSPPRANACSKRSNTSVLPFADDDTKALKAAIESTDHPKAIRQIQDILDKYCLAGVHINAESRVKVAEGPAKKELIQQGWRTFLVKVHNEAGINPKLVAESPNAAPLYMRGQGPRQRPLTEQKLVPPGEVSQRFLDIAMFDKQPQKPTLSGLELEYRIIQLYSRDAGKREAELVLQRRPGHAGHRLSQRGAGAVRLRAGGRRWLWA